MRKSGKPDLRARASKDARPPPLPLVPGAATSGLSPTDLGFTRDRMLSAQVGYSRLAMARPKTGSHLRMTDQRVTLEGRWNFASLACGKGSDGEGG
jgi:hypothetical protein